MIKIIYFFLAFHLCFFKNVIIYIYFYLFFFSFREYFNFPIFNTLKYQIFKIHQYFHSVFVYSACVFCEFFSHPFPIFLCMFVIPERIILLWIFLCDLCVTLQNSISHVLRVTCFFFFLCFVLIRLEQYNELLQVCVCFYYKCFFFFFKFCRWMMHIVISRG